MTKEFIGAVVRRFLRAFLAGGVAQAVLIMSTQPLTFDNLADMKKLILVLAVGFVTGGAMAVDKLLRHDKNKGY
ncbi:MAG: hypothetical protein ABIH23_10810 [bacterium]